MKKLIIVITIMLCIISVQAKAYEINPNLTRTTLYNTSMDPNSGTSVLQTTSPYNERFMNSRRMYNTLTYNNTGRMKDTYIYANFEQQVADRIVEFQYAIQTDLVNGDVMDITLGEIGIIQLDSGNYVYSQCGIIDRIAEEYPDNGNLHLYTIYTIHCITTKIPVAVVINYQINSPESGVDKRFYTSDITVRQPYTQDEIGQIQNEIKNEVAHNNAIIENAFSGTYDTTNPNMTFIESLEYEENRLMNQLNQMNGNIMSSNIDIPSNNFIWSTLRDFRDNAMGIPALMTIAMSLGIIKLVFGR